jgi:manganese/zinc/iron transport system permease protein
MTGVAFLLAYLFAPERGLVAQSLRRARQRWEFAQQMLALHLLNHQGTEEAAEECSPAHLVRHLHWRPAFADAVLRRAEQTGLVRRQNGLLALTERGQALAQEASLR